MIKVDCLLEVTARFFQAGDKTTLAELEDFHAWSNGEESACDNEEIVEQIPVEKRPFPNDGLLHEIDLDAECEAKFLQDIIGFRVSYVTEGRCDRGVVWGYGCGVGFECDENGMAWVNQHTEDFNKDALAVRDELMAKKKYSVPQRLPIRSVQWLVLFGYDTSYDGDSWTEYLGRISLQEMFDVIRNARGSLDTESLST